MHPEPVRRPTRRPGSARRSRESSRRPSRAGSRPTRARRRMLVRAARNRQERMRGGLSPRQAPSSPTAGATGASRAPPTARRSRPSSRRTGSGRRTAPPRRSSTCSLSATCTHACCNVNVCTDAMCASATLDAPACDRPQPSPLAHASAPSRRRGVNRRGRPRRGSFARRGSDGAYRLTPGARRRTRSARRWSSRCIAQCRVPRPAEAAPPSSLGLLFASSRRWVQREPHRAGARMIGEAHPVDG